MICPPCRDLLHDRCPELTRQDDGTLTDTERAASALCDCQHEPRQGRLIQRHADHDPSLICRPAGYGLCELAPLGVMS